ncbi:MULTISPECIES: alpha/beta hydrolase [unclassified Paenibacillus]|uniref:alpha/beta fold hydrolase n=1 Tax=unclassified Paenibacillus TaxID=185978 RepID=UPI002404B43F|nr:MULTISPECIES: alpha/beta hydrolase [unclassified Paenibacillus]MDF9839056.1 pimeloyl-ACP methyl ester carboxylesterase [Paenibacillus sp. PastF-2]MDF9845638.1 pimeloyl-ACP methyl ester carboxylesterase [Paenibacillus sp. PastM-2]MDF9852210.1 pimeloyl-ACP methyl ester carboxylesterase [Paenibacillus sp. PastF-1]MDH6478061.1 pimeloyl-ACP methyl ester carboxylesterase [Paenibacillus sp. PastH-2]MDH6505796.1 pimeloyl-ACP methyl ester carboxylesterase [Paenibacillus sp. PastM-3]
MIEEQRMISIYRKGGKPDQVMEAYDNTLRLWKVPVESVYVPTSFGQIHILIAGPEDAEPLVLLHGFGFSSTVWLDNIEALSRCYRVFAVDFPGDINKSRSVKPIKNKTDCAAWFTELLNGLHVDKAHVCGHSFGGFVALVLATRVSSRIRKIIILAPGASLQPQSKEFFIRCLFAGMMPTTSRINKLMDFMTGKGNNINQTIKNQFITGMQNALPRTKLFVSYIKDDDLKLIKAPVLLLIGDQDIQYNVDKAVKRARKLINGIEITVIPNTGHGLPLEKPVILNRLMLDFLSS